MPTTKHRGEPAYRLTFGDAVEVWRLRWTGELIHRIAASFDADPGRVSEVLRGKRHPGSEAAARLIQWQGTPANDPGAPSGHS